MAAKPALNSAVKLFSLSLDPFFGTPWQANRSITYTRDASGPAMAATSAVVGRLRAARATGAPAADIGYSAEERQASAGEPSGRPPKKTRPTR